jgi:hypothetical protein
LGRKSGEDERLFPQHSNSTNAGKADLQLLWLISSASITTTQPMLKDMAAKAANACYAKLLNPICLGEEAKACHAKQLPKPALVPCPHSTPNCLGMQAETAYKWALTPACNLHNINKAHDKCTMFELAGVPDGRIDA